MLSRIAFGLNTKSALTISRTALRQPQNFSRGFRETRGRIPIFRRTVRVTEVKSPIQGSVRPLEIGHYAMIGGSALGLGALCFYGLGMANEPGIIDMAAFWPEHVRTRIRDTYMYFGSSVAIAAASGIACFRSPTGQKFFALCQRHPILSTVGLIAAVFGSGTALMSVPYTPGLGVKQALWALNCGLLGLVAAPIGALGGAIALRAAWYTVGIVGGLSTVAVCAPSDKFLSWAGPLGIGLGGVFVACVGTLFVPPTSTFGLSLYSIALYGGLVVFSAMLLYDTQKVIRKAETHPVTYPGPWSPNMVPLFDPINASHRIFMDAINIFIRVAQIIAMGGNRRK